MKKTLTIAMLLVAASTSAAMAAPVGTGTTVSVNSIICSLQSKQCTALFDKPIAADTCTNKERVRWDASTPAGQNMLSLFEAAELSGKKVLVWWDGCIKLDDSHSDPALAWLQLL